MNGDKEKTTNKLIPWPSQLKKMFLKIIFFINHG